MNLVRCENGHFYDAEKYSVCPHCIEKTEEKLIENLSDFCGDAFVLETQITEVSLSKTYAQIRRTGKLEMTEKYKRVLVLGLPVSMRTSSLHITTSSGLINKSSGLFCYKVQDSGMEHGKDQEKTGLMRLQQILHREEEKIKSLKKYQNHLRKSLSDPKEFFEKFELLEEKIQSEIDIQIETEQKIAALQNQKKEEKLFWGIELDFVAESDGEYGCNIDYIVNQAGWESGYDIMTYQESSEIRLILHADIWQNTGEDWENVRLRLSNAPSMPNQRAAELFPMYIILSEKFHAVQSGSALDRNIFYEEDSEKTMSPEPTAPIMSAPQSNFYGDFKDHANAVEEHSDTQKHFLFQDQFSLLEGHKKMITLTNEKIEIEKKFFSIPKKECCEYVGMYAEVLKERTLLKCLANIYIDDVYSTSLFTKGIQESGIIILGRREGLIISRRVVKEQVIRKKLSAQTGLERKYEISIENETSEERELLVMDQIPISDDERVVVKDVRASHANIDEKGICEWNVVIPAKSKIVIPLEYKIFYPKDMQISGIY